jgi:hypothetical protein
MQTLEEAQEESGWKLVHGDVFRPPSFSPMFLSILAGENVLSTDGYCDLSCLVMSFHV